jgi:hypothetical protein
MADDKVSDEMKALIDLFNLAAQSKELAQKQEKACRSYSAATPFSVLGAGTLYAWVQHTLSIEMQTIEIQKQQQKKIEELEKRLQELETPRVVRLDKSSKPSPK